jgi:hypothetical protein
MVLKISFFLSGLLMVTGCTTGSYSRVATDSCAKKVLYKNGPKQDRYSLVKDKNRCNYSTNGADELKQNNWKLHAYSDN